MMFESARGAALGLPIAGLLSLAVATACGSESVEHGAPGAAGTATAEHQGSGSAGTATAAPTESPREVAYDLEKRWAVQPGRWNKAVAFHPEGDVVALSSRRAYVLARDSGALLEEAAVCSIVDDGAFFLPDGRLALVCENGVELVRLPGGARETVVSLNEKAAAGHLAAGTLAIGAGSRVRLYDTASWQPLETFEAAHEVNDVAVSPDGRHVAVATEANLQIFERGGAGRQLHDKRSRVVAFSADGSRLFAAATGFDGFILDVASGAKQVEMKTGSWVTAAVIVEPGLVVATGSNGLEVYGPAGGKAFKKLDAGPAVGVAVEAGRTCAGDRKGTIHCFSAGPLEPSGYVPAVAASGSKPTEASSSGDGFSMSVSDLSVSRRDDSLPPVSSATNSSLVGTLTSVSRGKLVMEGSGDRPPSGTTGTLSKQVDQKLGSSTITMWLGIAEVKVVAVSDSKLTLQVLEEKSVMHVNGQKTNHFTKGAKTKLAW